MEDEDDIDLADWAFSEQSAFGVDPFALFDNESPCNILIRIARLYCGSGHFLIGLPGWRVLSGLARISFCPHKVLGLGALVADDSVSDALVVSFFNAHQVLFFDCWLPRKNDEFVAESFRVYWDNLFSFGGEALKVRLREGGDELQDCIRGLREQFRAHRYFIDTFDHYCPI